MRPDLSVGLPLLGLSKDRPSIVPRQRVRRPGSTSPWAPSGNDSQPFPRSALVVLHHLGGLLLSNGAGLLRPAPDPGVHRVSARRETSILTMRSCPSKLSLRRQRRPRLPPEPRARVTESPIAGRPLHRSPCPLTLRSVHREAGFPFHVRRGLPRRLPGAGASRPCSIVGSVAPVSVATHEGPLLPWAWPVVPVASPIRSSLLAERRAAGRACLQNQHGTSKPLSTVHAPANGYGLELKHDKAGVSRVDSGATGVAPSPSPSYATHDGPKPNTKLQ
jgi:hypothetical protein